VALSRVWRISPADVMQLDVDLVNRMLELLRKERRR